MIDLPFSFKYGVNDVPILSNSQIDGHAESLLQRYDPHILQSPHSLDVEDFAENFLGLNFHYTYLSNHGFIWGRMVFNDTRIIVYNKDKDCADEEPVDAWTIVIDNDLLDERQEHAFRSTVMHECGHAIYHDEYYYIDYFQLPLENESDGDHLPYTSCLARDIMGGNRSNRLITDLDWIEHQAKYFSAAILMPRTAMNVLRSSKKIWGLCHERFPGYENDALTMIVSKRFNVSPESAKIRIKQLRLQYYAPSPAPDSYFDVGNKYAPALYAFDQY